MSDSAPAASGSTESASAPVITAERLFNVLLWPLYPDDVRADLEGYRARDANPANNPAIRRQLADAAERFVSMTDSVLGMSLALDFTDASVHRLGAELTRERRDRWIKERAPDGLPVIVHVLIHGVAYLGECVVRNHGGTWAIRHPLWESRVHLTSRAGEGDLTLLSWWLRALSDEEIGRGTLTERYRRNVEVPCMSPEQLPVMIKPDRQFPRLKHPSYDKLHKYIRAHLPELRDLGADFPSAERFAELDFGWLETKLLGEGRMVLFHGPSAQGVFLIWLDTTGFVKSAYYPADAFPEHVVQLEGDKLRLIVPLLDKNVVHEMLWWGP
ncbi:MAG: hypothetical protein U0165_00495 [Polyangiaceae bacterium]